ncbi:MAG: 2-C-methyl-D-erythritol 2,4-cyclodiphosphate synthase [Patescibacteria group bacterium]
MKISAILLAAGKGERLKKSSPKAFVQVGGKEMFLHSLETLQKRSKIKKIILVVPKNKISEAKKLAGKNVVVTVGGKSRVESLERGLQKVRGDYVLVHNAANPFVTTAEISRCIQFAKKWKAVGVGRRASSTVRLNSKTLDRNKVWLMETPQVIERRTLERGLVIAKKQKIEVTDELQLAELVGVKAKVIAASEKNRKITKPLDLKNCSMFYVPCSTRIGLGVDSHRFSQRKKALVLGGVRISTNGGLEGNSDGDVLLHALTNALSSALSGGSLSTFSDSMCRKGIKDSRKYLEVVLKRMEKRNCVIENVSVALEGARPKLEKHFPKIKKSLGKLLSVNHDRVGLTATTGEELTAWGRGEGLQCFALVLLRRLC